MCSPVSNALNKVKEPAMVEEPDTTPVTVSTWLVRFSYNNFNFENNRADAISWLYSNLIKQAKKKPLQHV